MLKKCVALALLTLVSVSKPIFSNDDIPTEKTSNLMENEIKHIVILMMENRSFDNLVAWLYENDDVPLAFIPKGTDPHYLGLTEDTLAQYTNYLKDSSGKIVFSSPPIKGIPSVSSTNLLNSPKFNPNEAFPNVMPQIFGADGGTVPTMTGFLQDYATLWDEEDWDSQLTEISAVMETYTEKELPVLHSLAKRYAISDLWFSSVPTQTNPNRAFTFCGTSDGEVVNGPLGKNQFASETIWNRLYELSPSTTWKIFWQVDMIPDLFPGPSSGTNNFPALALIPNFDDHFEKIDRFHELARTGQLPDVCFLEPQWTISINLSPTDEELMMLVAHNQDQIFGLQGTDLHPPGDVRPAENFLANIYTSLTANPETWKHTLLIITFDEHGGLFDHVPPPVAIGPDDLCQNGFAFDRFGVRVPTLFISPRINKSTVVRSSDPNTPFDHTSLLSTILKWKNIEKARWNMGRRVAAAPTFDSVITLSEPRQDDVLAPDTVVLPQVDEDKVIHMGDKFYLNSKKGESFVVLKPQKHGVNPLLDVMNDRRIRAPKANDWHFARVGDANHHVPLQFVGGAGKITHGSFVLIQSTESSLGTNNFLETMDSSCDCVYGKNSHSTGVWWTIKSVDHPYVGSVIQSGDRVYLENHVYLDFVQYVPARLTQEDSYLSEYLTVVPITDSHTAEHYWYIEKAVNN